MSSCEEDPTKIGTDLLPGSDFVSIKSTDTISVWSYTMYDEFTRTDNPAITYLGDIYDSYFGTTTAGFVSEVRMGFEWDDKPFTVDSVKLFLVLLDVIGGGTDIVHTLKISEISEQIYTDSVYYANQVVAHSGYELNDIVLPSLKQDTVNSIGIDLPVEFGEYLLRDTAKLFYSNTRPDFRAFFNGLEFSMNPSSEHLLVSLVMEPPDYIGLWDNGIVVYMHDDAGVFKEFTFNLDATNRNAAFNKFSHDFSTATSANIEQIVNKVSKPDPADTLSYLQNLSGVYTKLVLPGLKELKNDPAFDNIAINKARLTVPVFFDGAQYKASTVPPQLILRYRHKDGTKYIVPDYSLDQYHSFYGGYLDATNNVYRFNIAAFVQGYLEDDSDDVLPDLEIFQFSGIKNAIFKANSSSNPVKFDLTYTRY